MEWTIIKSRLVFIIKFSTIGYKPIRIESTDGTELTDLKKPPPDTVYVVCVTKDVGTSWIYKDLSCTQYVLFDILIL